MVKKIFFLFIVIFSVVFTPAQAAESQPIHWQEWSTSAFSAAKKEHKLILIYGGVSWCHWCQQMEATAFQDPAVVQLVRKRYIPIHIDVEESEALASRYDIEGFPTVLIVDEDNRVLKRYSGYTSSDILLGRLKDV